MARWLPCGTLKSVDTAKTPGMSVGYTTNTGQYLDRVAEFLRRRPVEHSVLLSVAASHVRILGRFAWPPLRRENGGGAAVRDAVFTVMPMSSYVRMVLGTTDRNCRLLLEHEGETL